MTNAFENMLVSMIGANKASLREIAKCKSIEEAKPMADSLVARDGFDAAEGFLRMGLDKSMPFGRELYDYIDSKIKEGEK